MIPSGLDSELRACVDVFARELVDLVKRSVRQRIESTLNDPIGIDTTPAGVAPRAATGLGAGPVSFEAYERMALLRAIDESGGDPIAAARALAVGKSTLYRRLKHHGIPPSPSARNGTAHEPYLRTDGPVSLERYERLALEHALARTGGSKLAAAKLLRVGKSTAYRLAAKHGL